MPARTLRDIGGPNSSEVLDEMFADFIVSWHVSGEENAAVKQL